MANTIIPPAGSADLGMYLDEVRANEAETLELDLEAYIASEADTVPASAPTWPCPTEVEA